MPEIHNDLVQICLPTYNGEAHLAEALDSLLAQTHSNIKIYVMDNASTDRTTEICQSYAKKDARTSYFRSDEFVCASENWNRAFGKIDRSASNYFMWASDDDLWSPDYIERLLKPLIFDSALVLSYSQFDTISVVNNGKSWTGYQTIYPRGGTFSRIRNLIVAGRYSAIYGVMRLVALNWSPPMVDMSFGSDLWFMIRLAAMGRFHIVTECLFHKRPGGISETNVDLSASSDASSTWNLGSEEWTAISSLELNLLTKLYIFNRLRVSSKLLFPSKNLPLFLHPWVLVLGLRANIRAFGVRSRILKLVHFHV